MKQARIDFKLDGDGPLYRQIRRAIARPILAGHCAVGARLPSEHDFMDRFGTSRMTVNRALQMLADEGLVSRQRRNGTFVAAPAVEHAVMELRDIGDEVAAAGAIYSYKLIRQRRARADRVVASRLGIERGAAVLHVVCLHCSDGEPVLVEHRYINMAAVEGWAEVDFATTPPGRWLLQNVPWSRAEHVIRALGANNDIAQMLAIAPGAACLCIERTTWHDNLPVTFVTLTYPGERHRLVGTFTPGQ
ncbi:MAG TPA: histidine utilization repressor [Rhodospirillales bacterium]|nr:histidine utilization repressor [Rhodospirillales bacterium]